MIFVKFILLRMKSISIKPFPKGKKHSTWDVGKHRATKAKSKPTTKGYYSVSKDINLPTEFDVIVGYVTFHVPCRL